MHGRWRAQAGAPPLYVETSQKAPPCPAASCGACAGTTCGTSCRFRSVSEGCISRRGGAARPSAARNSRHRGRTRQPAAAKPHPTNLKDDTITADNAKDAPGTGTKTALKKTALKIARNVRVPSGKLVLTYFIPLPGRVLPNNHTLWSSKNHLYNMVDLITGYNRLVFCFFRLRWRSRR